jgi:hypothetical protein
METKPSALSSGRNSSGGICLRTQRIFAGILLLAAFAEFVVRGPLRNLHPTNWNDLAQFYASSRLWLRGEDFASPDNFVALWRDEVGSTLSSHTIRTHIAPPPGCLVLYAPIAALPWPWAKIVWLAVLLAAFAATVWALAKTVGFRTDEPRTLAFIAACCALAPFHTGIASANAAILVVGLCTLGICAATGRRDIAAGLLFGAACSLKPHVGSFLVLYYLVRRRWRLFGTAVGLTAVLALVAILWMQVKGVTWAPDYFHNMKVAAAQNKIDDFTSANPIRFMLINLQVPLYSFTRSARESNILALVCGAFLVALWIYFVLRDRGEKSELLALSAIAVIGLLPVYHRLYDASLLAVPLCWCVSELAGRARNIARIALLLAAPFLVPGTAVLQQLAIEHKISTAWTQSWWWERLIMPHQTWLLLLLAVVLLYEFARETRTRPLRSD